MDFQKIYDVIVVGAGHAGCEASLAAARMGADTLLLTISIDNIALMPCNPAIGGIGKGNLVKDMDALGGEMAKNIDETGIQFRVLNKRKGPAVWCSRAQADKYLYKNRFQTIIMNTPSLDVKQGIVTEVLVENRAVRGVETACGQTFLARRIVICGGTFIGGEIFIGDRVMEAGRMYEPAATGLSLSLKKIGFKPLRLKTDTPARLHIDSLSLNGLEEYVSDNILIPFSTETKSINLPQIKCYGTQTNEETHKVIREAAEKSLFYNGARQSNGPRYCPSMEDKVLKFPEKTGHKLVIEPEGLNTKEVHVNGFSCSIPAYAVQYDAYQPTGLNHNYETKLVKGLFFGGQLNGTSGYEEAAVQGFMAGVNAVLSLDNKEPFILGRNESYIGVLTDDLVLKGITEPYRMFTSRSEFRLLTREDNAEERLISYGYKLGLISKTRYERYQQDMQEVNNEIERLKNTLIKKNSGNEEYLSKIGVSISQSFKAEELLKRPQLSYDDIIKLTGGGLSGRKARQVEIKVKYSGYIESMEESNKEDIESIVIPDNFSYDNISGLRLEYSDKLKNIKPKTLGQALRIPGLTKTAVSVLAVEIYKHNKINKS